MELSLNHNNPTLLVAHLHFLPTQKPNKKMQKSYQANAPKTP